MRKEITSFFVLILLTSFVLAAGPSFPHGFNGNIIVENGANPNGKILVGYVGTVATGRAIIQNGKFDIVVTDYPDAGPHEKVEFYIGNKKAGETFIFNAFEVTKTNLTFGNISQEQNQCGNGICNVGECSFCAIDCDVSDCVVNGRCDIEIGESCSNSPADCASICVHCGDGFCNNGETCSTCSQDCGACQSPGGNGGSPGSPGSGGGGSSHNLLSTKEDEDEEVLQLTTNQDSDENETENKPQENSISSFLTGAVTGFGDFVKSDKSIYALIGAITVVVLGIATFVARKKKPAEVVKEEVSETSEKKETE